MANDLRSRPIFAQLNREGTPSKPSQIKINSSFLIAKYKNTCQDLQKTYRQVYGFETQNFYINICQVNNDFLYHRQSKSDPNERILIPAQPVFGGDVFQAVNGKITYFVGMEERGYYSSVMYNSNEIVLEPEISSSERELAENRAILSKYPKQDLDLGDRQLKEELFSYSELDNKARICTQDQADIHPNFNGWQKFIGQSPKVAGQYALENGHDFIYDGATSTQAFIKTADGLIVNLNIATFSETVERICVNPIAEK